ncbi:MAG: macro domain-containing protein [bacterium]
MTRIEFIKGDITQIDTEAIVNAGNIHLSNGSGVNGAIHRAAGPDLDEECRAIEGNPRCPTGEARITGGYNLPAEYIIHTVGPVYRGGNNGEAELLYNSFYNSLSLAVEKGIKTIAFPAISTGVFSYPHREAAEISVSAVKDFIGKHSDAFERIVFVLFSDEIYRIFKEQGEDSGLL